MRKPSSSEQPIIESGTSAARQVSPDRRAISTNDPVGDNFQFERAAAVLAAAQERIATLPAEDTAREFRTSPEDSQAPKIANSEAAAPASGINAESAAYVSDRLQQAIGIVAVASRAFAADYPPFERPDTADIFTTLGFAGRLLHECNDHLETIDDALIGCWSDPWWSDLTEAIALVDMLDKVMWSQGIDEIPVPDLHFRGFLSGVSSSMDRAATGLKAGQQAKATNDTAERSAIPSGAVHQMPKAGAS